MKRAVIFAAVLLPALSALAYVLPGSSILRRMTEARDELQLFTLRVDGSVNIEGSLAPEVAKSLGLLGDRTEVLADAAISLKLPNRCRFEVSSVEGGKFAIASSGGKVRAEGNVPAPFQLALQEVCVLLASRSSSEGEAKEQLQAHLERLKVQQRVTSLGRFGGQVAYVIGKVGEREPQLWVYKDAFLPARLRFLDAQGVLWDLRLLDYTSPATGEWFPRTVELARESEVLMRFTSLKADSKGKLADALF